MLSVWWLGNEFYLEFLYVIQLEASAQMSKSTAILFWLWYCSDICTINQIICFIFTEAVEVVSV